ncbi:MAG: sigma-E factor negative regulatory protein [Stenotrophomonas sp.]|uniref:sigma-E factor negative regulatory protein n=1 Tax=Stenotrophomonas sp. TaxID=69392 RepID=UPI003D6D86D5
MNSTRQTPEIMNTNADKFELHYQQQLSALVDGELAADEARFMLRRLEHDADLSACQERWQMLGDTLRGQACAPAPMDFSAKVRAAIAADIKQHGPVQMTPQRPARSGWMRWSGGAALAASVAAVALFMAREQLPGEALPDPVIATTAQVSSMPVQPAPDAGQVVGDAAALVAAAPAVAVAVARRQDATQRRGSATRTQQAARASSIARVTEPQRALAAAPALPVPAVASGLQRDPFAAAGNLQARPWPRSALSQSGALNASFPVREQGGATFYPFEPRLPAHEADAAELPRLTPRH